MMSCQNNHRKCGRNGVSLAGRRHGIAVPLVLMVIVLAMSLAAALIRVVALQHAHAETVARQYQAFWLAESGVQRATTRLRQSPRYDGETWRVPAASLDGAEGGTVTIEVETTEDQPDRWHVTVDAVFPDNSPLRVAEHRELWIPYSLAQESSE